MPEKHPHAPTLERRIYGVPRSLSLPRPPIHPRNPLLPCDPPRRVPMHPRRRGQSPAREEVRHNGRADFRGDGGTAGTVGAFPGATAAAHCATHPPPVRTDTLP